MWEEKGKSYHLKNKSHLEMKICEILQIKNMPTVEGNSLIGMGLREEHPHTFKHFKAKSVAAAN